MLHDFRRRIFPISGLVPVAKRFVFFLSLFLRQRYLFHPVLTKRISHDDNNDLHSTRNRMQKTTNDWGRWICRADMNDRCSTTGQPTDNSVSFYFRRTVVVVIEKWAENRVSPRFRTRYTDDRPGQPKIKTNLATRNPDCITEIQCIVYFISSMTISYVLSIFDSSWLYNYRHCNITDCKIICAIFIN